MTSDGAKVTRNAEVRQLLKLQGLFASKAQNNINPVSTTRGYTPP